LHPGAAITSRRAARGEINVSTPEAMEIGGQFTYFQLLVAEAAIEGMGK